MFVFLFLPVVVSLYYLAKDWFRNYILLAASLLFYAYGEPRFVFVMIFSIAVNYWIACYIDHARSNDRGKLAKILLLLDISANVGLLFVYKYLNYSLLILNRVTGLNLPRTNIVLPIGISFFTFQDFLLYDWIFT